MVVKQAYDRLIRPYTPRTIGVHGGVPVRQPRLFDANKVVPHEKRELVRLAGAFTRPNDDVGVVGAGWGVSAAAHGRRVMPGGVVTVYDSSKLQLQRAIDTAEINQVADVVMFENKAVGTPMRQDFYDGSDEAVIVEPTDLPQYDVLELDCEGAEEEIVTGLNYKPRVLTVECHVPFGTSMENVGEMMRDMGYEVVKPVGTHRNAMPIMSARDFDG